MLRFLRLPKRIPVRLPDRQTGHKWAAAAIIAILATAVAIAWRHTAIISKPMGLLDDVLYDSLYALRTPEDRTDGPVVIVAIGPTDLQRLNTPAINDRSYPWPWPRVFYASMVQYLERCGAKVVAFDLLFSEESIR